MKIFRDPLHGYIEIPENYVNDFIDTKIFQRLKYIDQTSYRSLFHCARHDRFSHSLGVFYMANKILNTLIKNSHKDAVDILQEPDVSNSFEIAALMHDCAHAPFSHTLEVFYNDDQRAEKLLLELTNNEINEDYDGLFITNHPKPHEIVSSIMLIKHYSEQCTKNNVNLEYAIRMILGLSLGNNIDDKKTQVVNILINLINGEYFDADKFDYILRDTWATGMNNISIDIYRLISSMKIDYVDDELKLCFKSSSLNIIKDFCSANDNLRNRIMGHHTVVYFQGLLKLVVEYVIDELKKKDKTQHPFSFETFENHVKIDNDSFYLVTDGDVLHLLKKFLNSDYHETDPIIKKYIEEILSRQTSMYPLWKSEIEYDIFKRNNSIKNNQLDFLSNCQEKKLDKSKEKLIDLLNKKGINCHTNEIMVINVKLKNTNISDNEDIYILR